MVQVLFATNRQSLGVVGGLPAFGSTLAPLKPGTLTCATATVDGIVTANPSSGTIGAITAGTAGAFAPAELAPILQSDRDILIFVHGAANSFTDAVTRAAYVKTWLSEATLPNGTVDFDVIAFTWPSRAYFIANIGGDALDYHADQAAALSSSYHFDQFLALIRDLRGRIDPRRRLNLLCHSMGNYMLGSAIETGFTSGTVPAQLHFDEVVLAAADEPADTFSYPQRNNRLSKLPEICRQITVYFKNDDILMALSQIVNQVHRLGYDGPPNAADKGFFPPPVYEFVDCSAIDDYISSFGAAPDRTHQYYRQSPTVRDDIAAVLAGFPRFKPQYDPRANIYKLFPPTLQVALAVVPPPGRDG